MDPAKHLGIGKEQVRIEHLARRNFEKKWAKLGDEKLNRFYNQNEVNQQLQDILRNKELCPYKYTGNGDSYFVSPDMYNSLLAKCRCGRKRSETHILKCLQKAENPNSQRATSADVSKSAQSQSSENACQPTADRSKSAVNTSFPRTSNSLIGYQKRPSSYKQWENSMKHISPIATMPQPRLTATSYNILHIA
ncbi:PREDICTED: uncharacterized protein LOC108978143 [Bactrocera latifrons]|uniref:uncharacterized protein LOC108978143 n=1 Tax=Bactrocera latifrons TaxID=174628 RepID=UPI0008DDEC99|nr:PREDICTED: uncharacterized protein LOC108978143 [Bactrocera latifrons]